MRFLATASLISFMITLYILPIVIKLSLEKNLCVKPNERSSHTVSTPQFGGIGIFLGIIAPLLLLNIQTSFFGFGWIFAAVGLIFLMGLKDDLEEMSPGRKLLGQLFAAGLIIASGVKLTSLYGIFGIQEIPEFAAISLTAFTIIVIINAFNLIDGINGLSGGISLLVSIVLGIWFYLVEDMEYALIAFAIAGAILAFLRYNITPARIFMGDSGSLVLGLWMAILTIHFIELHQVLPSSNYTFEGVPAIAISILIFPLFDTARVFCIRILKGRSPLSPDRHHIHHMLIDVGYSHSGASLMLVAFNAFYIFIAVLFQSLGPILLLSIIIIPSCTLTILLRQHLRKKKKQNEPTNLINPVSSIK